jgi:hypothetical protein
MIKKNLKIVSFRIEKPKAIELKQLLKDKSLNIAYVYRQFTHALLIEPERVLNFIKRI